MDSNNIWVSTRMEQYFENKIMLPYFNSNLYHPILAPIPYCQAIVGREGIQKVEMIEYLLTKANIFSMEIINVSFGKTSDAIMHIMTALDGCIGQPVENGPCRVIVINHADILCYEPDNEQSLLKATEIAAKAKASNAIVIAICDRAQGTKGDNSQNMTAWARTCQTKFFAQFDSVGFASAPNGEFRSKYIKSAIDTFTTHCHAQGRKLIVELSETDYKLLEDYSTYSTQGHLMDWLQKVFVGLLEDECRIILDIDFMCGFIGKRMGVPHVCDFDARAVEDLYSSSTGAGPIAPLKSGGFTKAVEEKIITMATNDDDAVPLVAEKRDGDTKLGFEKDEFAFPPPLEEKEEEEKPKRKKRAKK